MTQSDKVTKNNVILSFNKIWLEQSSVSFLDTFT